jgi:hypothetical protein
MYVRSDLSFFLHCLFLTIIHVSASKSPHSPKDVNSVLELTFALVGGLAAPWVIALAIGLVSVARGQGKLVWNYRGVWGESKAEGVIAETHEKREKVYVIMEHMEDRTI